MFWTTDVNLSSNVIMQETNQQNCREQPHELFAVLQHIKNWFHNVLYLSVTKYVGIIVLLTSQWKKISVFSVFFQFYYETKQWTTSTADHIDKMSAQPAS